MMDSDLSTLADMNAERALLGAILLDNHSLYHCAGLTQDDFFTNQNRTIFNAICALSRTGQPIDPISVKDQLRSMNGQGATLEYIAGLIDGVVVSNVSGIVRVLRELGLRRRL